MNKKVISIGIVLLALTLILTPTASACRHSRSTVETFTTTPLVDPSTMTNMEDLEKGTEKYVHGGTIRIAQGALREFDYTGPLGTGTLYLKTIKSIGHLEVPNDISISTGRGIYRYTLTIDNGPYGTGTLVGVGHQQWDYNATELRFEGWDSVKLVPIKGDLNIKSVSVEGYSMFFDWWWITTTLVSRT